MEENKIRLTYKCPVKWDSMAAAGKDKYCSICEKTVTDFTKKPVQEIASAEVTVTECGSFKATQLHRPFNDFRDTLIEYYQHILPKRSSRKVALMFVTVLLFLTGCRSRRLGGAYSYGPWDYKGNNTVASADTVVSPDNGAEQIPKTKGTIH